MSKKSNRYALLSGEDGEKYAVPVDRIADFKKWIYSSDWENGQAPDYVLCINHNFTFTDPSNK